MVLLLVYSHICASHVCYRVFFTVEKLSASRRDCITAVGALLQVAVVDNEHKPIKY